MHEEQTSSILGMVSLRSPLVMQLEMLQKAAGYSLEISRQDWPEGTVRKTLTSRWQLKAIK